MELGAQIMMLSYVHCLCKTDIGADGGAEEVKGPESWSLLAVIFTKLRDVFGTYPE